MLRRPNRRPYARLGQPVLQAGLRRQSLHERGLVPTGVTRIVLYGRRAGKPAKKLRRYRPRRGVVIRLRPGRWRLWTRAADAAGNVELSPPRPDARLRVTKRRR